MKVFVVLEICYDIQGILGIYQTNKAAEDAIHYYKNELGVESSYYDFVIEEFDMNSISDLYTRKAAEKLIPTFFPARTYNWTSPDPLRDVDLCYTLDGM